ncbi:MAG: S-layer homology domain-containing protein, partial [Slackia sp.]|nr:S-layer homology domain-containing protein [Slackia sp.]
AGMVPAAAAFADDAQVETASEGDVELLAVSAADAFSKGTVKLDNNKVEWTGNAFEPKVTSVTPLNGKAVNVNDSDDYKVYYVTADAKGEPTTTKVEAPTEIGTYFVAVEAVAGNYEGGIAYAKFEITGKNLGTVTAFEVNASDATDTADTAFAYTAETQNIGFVNDKKEILVNGKDFTVKYYTAGEDYNNPAAGSETVRNAGTYTARLTGMGAYAGTVATVTVNVAALDLSAADIYVEQVVGATAQMPTAPTTVNGSKALAAEVGLTYADVVGDKGSVNATAAAATKDDSNFTGTKQVEVVKVNKAATFTYNDAAMPETLNINLAKKEAFDASLIKVMDGETALEAGKYEVKYTKADGSPAQEGDLAKAGSYIVTVTVKADQTNYELGGSVQMAVNVTAGTIDCDTNLFVRYNGAVVDSIEADYTGASVADAITVTLLGPDGKTPLEKGKDFKVQYTDAEGNVVKAKDLVNAGSYTIQIVSDSYQIENGTFDIIINPVEVMAVKVQNLSAVNGRMVLQKGTAPVLQVATERDQDGKLVWTNYAGSAVEAVSTAVYSKDGVKLDKFDENVVGHYTVALEAKDVEDAVNFDFQAAPFEFDVDVYKVFLDVPESEWFHPFVMKASMNDLGYIGGYADGKFFGPNDNIKRGDVCVILARMGNVELDIDNGGVFTPYETGFGDVDANSYYAQAIKWAADAGIVQGYADGENFGPEDQVTREQFATMLYRYAKMSGTDVSADVEAELAKYTDGAEITEFAREAIAWASEDGIMQGIGDTGAMAPQQNVTRAQVAKMAVVYQPAKLS